MPDLELAPGVSVLRVRRVNVVAILGPVITLIDAGLPGSGPHLGRALAAHGRSLDDVGRVICTHGHPDHAGGAAELASRGVEVLIHPADAARLPTTFGDVVRSPGRGQLFAALTPQPPATTPILDGDVLPELGGLQVIHTPGHTPGSVCLWARRHGLLFVGDALQRRFGRVGYASRLYSDDYRAAQRAVQRLTDLDVTTVVFGHYPPLVDDARGTLDRLARAIAT